MKKLISALLLSASLSILSAPVFADAQYSAGNHILRNNERAIATEVTSTKQAAYKNGYAKLLSIKEKSGSELKKELRVWVNDPRLNKSLHLDDVFVTVTEFVEQNGNIAYQGIVNVEYHYQEINRN